MNEKEISVSQRGRTGGAADGPLPGRDILMVCLFSVLLFFAVTVQTGMASMILLAAALVLSAGRAPVRHVGERLSVPVLGLLLFALMNGLAAVYSAFGQYAVSEFYKFVAAFSVAWILLTRFEKKHVRGLLWGLAAVSAIIGLLCVDSAAQGTLFQGFNTLMEALGTTFSNLALSNTSRVNGIYNDANVSAAILGMGAIVSLYLAVSEDKIWRRFAACILLGMSAQSFFLALSRGAILCFGLALLVWLIAAGRGERLRLFLLMLFAAAVTVALSIPAMAALDIGAALPTILTAATGPGIFVLDFIVSAPLARALEGRGKLIALVTGALVLAAGICVFKAFTTTGPHVFQEGEYLSRTLDLDAGAYTLSGDWDGELTLLVYAQDEKDRISKTSTTLYSGPLGEASFTVPEGETVRTTLRFYSDAGGETIRGLTLSDGTQIPLEYPLLPSFVVVRMQDSLMSSSSFTLRVQFMKDALALFRQSPVIGHGLGSTEGLYTSVQPYFYQSLYVHNHVLQVMSDMGLLGLLGFLGLLLGVLWLLVKALRADRDPLAAMLLSCWVMMNAHSLMEINFSIRAFQCIAYVILLLAVLLYAGPLTKKAARLCGWAAAGCFWAYALIFGGLLFSHRCVQREAAELAASDPYEFLDAMRGYTRRDVFDHENYQLTFVGNAVLLDTPAYNATMEKYVKELRDSGTYTACSGLARYYYLPRGEFEELFACSREGIAQEASTREAWNLQLDFYRAEVLPAAGAEHMDEFAEGVLALKDYLEEYSRGRLEEISLSEENRSLLNAVSSAKENGVPGDGLYLLLMAMFGAQEEAPGGS